MRRSKRGSGRAGSVLGRLALVLACGSAAVACSSSDGADAGHGEDAGTLEVGVPEAGTLDAEGAGAADARDAGRRDARADTGVRDAGLCGCSYGFHQECGTDEICETGYAEAPRNLMCVRTDPGGGAMRGGCTIPQGGPLVGACNGQCASWMSGSPCAAYDNGALEGTFDNWYRAMNNASTMYRDVAVPETMRVQDIDAARGDGSLGECNNFIAWSTLGILKLCRGDDALVPADTGQWNVIEAWKFRPIASDDVCRLFAGAACVIGLRRALNPGDPNAISDMVNRIPENCPGGLPFGSPCAGSNELSCVEGRLRTIFQALRTRSR